MIEHPRLKEEAEERYLYDPGDRAGRSEER